MKRLTLGILIFHFASILKAQNILPQISRIPQITIGLSDSIKDNLVKRPIDTSSFYNWSSVEFSAISNNGLYVLYTINNQPIGSATVVIRAVNSDWKMEFVGGNAAGPVAFTSDSRISFISKSKDSLCIVTLSNLSVDIIPDVMTYKLPRTDNTEWLAYKNINSEELILRNLKTGYRKKIPFIKDFYFSDDGKNLLLETQTTSNDSLSHKLNLMNLSKEKNVKTIWSSLFQKNQLSNFTFDNKLNQFAYMVEDSIQNKVSKSIWYFKNGMRSAIRLTCDSSKGLDSNLELDQILCFNNDNSSLFFTLKESSNLKQDADAVQVDIYSYMDPKLQSQQLKELNSKSTHSQNISILHIQDQQIIRLEKENDQIISDIFTANDLENKYILIKNVVGDSQSEWNWNSAAKTSIYLVCLKDGKRTLISDKLSENIVSSYVLSPNGKYLIYYDPNKKTYNSYNVLSGKIINIVPNIDVNWISYDNKDIPASEYMPLWTPAFVEGDKIIIYDRYDIYLADISGKMSPINLTNGYGNKHNTIFRLTKDYGKIISSNEKLILAAFNMDNKYNGFYFKELGKEGDPKLLSMGPYYYFGSGESVKTLIKARDKNFYIVRRMSAVESPNYFITSDFKIFNSLSNIQPQQKYNWLSAELISWTTFNGNLGQGILYKPENFDKGKRYPVIINYYERKSNELHAFLKPDFISGPINIPYFVSNGYLVLTPDIDYIIGEPGKSAYNSIVSATAYLSRLNFVDSNKIGLQGHSFGGFETNYIITHTNRFAAAMSSSGMANFISAYGSIVGDGTSRQRQYELYRDRIGSTPWERLDLYIDNSPVLNADKVSTPLLMMNNKMDGDVPYSQGVEFFTALRRLGKKVWMLQYDGEDHMVYGKASIDLTIRMKQFFDYYLMDSTLYKWMSHGVPARMKGIDNGFKVDSIRTLMPGLISEDNK